MSNLFSDNLKRLRGPLKKAAFARYLGVSAPDYQRYENGRMPRADVLSAISSRLKISVEQLISCPVTDHSDETAEVREPPAAYSAPAESADASRLDEVVARLDKMQTQIDTVLRLLGHRLK
jgi:transcriptional regulator with XRE-family HTH domain